MGKKKHAPREGICKLTGRYGRFTDSHILPKALTRADGLGPGLMQVGKGRAGRRASSWYDQKLVVEDGEKILAKYDDWAISFMRRHTLIWSGWGPRVALTNEMQIAKTSFGVRSIEIDSVEPWKKLRVFFLSLLWRAAATKLSEFDKIKLSDLDIERLRKMVLEENPEPQTFFPISLTQISTLGLRHNHSPIAQMKIIPKFDGKNDKEEPIFRFYIDGLIIHFSRLSEDENRKLNLGSGLIDHNQNATAAAIQMAEKKVWAHLS